MSSENIFDVISFKRFLATMIGNHTKFQIHTRCFCTYHEQRKRNVFTRGYGYMGFVHISFEVPRKVPINCQKYVDFQLR